MHDGFITLEEWFRPPVQIESVDVLPIEEPVCDAPALENERMNEAIAAVKRFSAAVADAVDMVLEDLLRDIACDVVCRELFIGPVDVRAVVARAKQRYAFDEPVAIHVHPDDCAALVDSGTKIVGDARMRRGDVVLAVRSGTIDATLGARLDTVLAVLRER